MLDKKHFSIKFLPSGKTIKVPGDYNLRQAILDCGIDIESACDGVGTCGRCKVQVKSGNIYSKKVKFINARDRDEGYVLSCLSKVRGDAIVFVPEKKKVRAKIEEGNSKLYESKVYSGVKSDEFAQFDINPWIIKEEIIVESPTLNYATTDLYRLRKSLKTNFSLNNVAVPLSVLRKLPGLLRENNFKITATVDKKSNSLINIQPPGKKKYYGFSLDIGTTTLVLQVVDLTTGEIIGSTSGYNPQIKFGEDIINRIIYSTKSDGLNRLRNSVIDSINNMILKLLTSTNINEEDIVLMLVAGNSTMMHIFYGVSPKFIREVPYITVANQFSKTDSSEMGLKYIKNVAIYNIEGVASFLGGDITSGVLAVNMSKREGITLFIDLGTNGEIVVGNFEWMMGCSCSAGPAFEGGGVRCGSRAVQGAIEKVFIDEDTYKCFYQVIGDSKPVGICGAGLIDLMGEMFSKGIIDRKGKFNKGIGNSYLTNADGDFRYIIAESGNSGTGEDIFISEIDIDNLMRAKAAVYSGIKTILEDIGLKIADIEKVCIAGGLGTNLNIKNAVTIGMLPDINTDRYAFVGNTSIMGAYLCLLSENKFDYTSEIAEKITYIELSTNMKFMDRYVAGLFLPYTDLKDFPSVR
ncbi:MAG: ASKHA domain-containing protein [Actinomycetota bacterium]|nr:ASKHA domain-containing protein [Actinomycetota bacterium]